MWSLFKLKDPRLLFSVHGLIVVTPIFQLALVGLQLRLSYFLLGMIYANFMEYYNHLVNFHTIPHLISQRAYFVMHGHHHKYPDRNPITPLPQTLFLYVVSDLLFRLIFPENHSHVLAGGAFGFLIFEASHVFIHKVEREEWKAAWLRPMIDYHLTHHIDPKRAYGFTSPFWDWCFGNLPSRERCKHAFSRGCL